MIQTLHLNRSQQPYYWGLKTMGTVTISIPQITVAVINGIAKAENLPSPEISLHRPFSLGGLQFVGLIQAIEDQLGLENGELITISRDRSDTVQTMIARIAIKLQRG